jgi:vitamin B12 transporter
MSFRLLLLAGALGGAPLAAAAQSPVSEVLVTASRVTASTTTPYSAAVIPAGDLAGRSNAAEALNTLADVYVQTPGGRAGAASIFLRGADPNFTVVLLDGVPLNNSTNSRGGAVNVSEIGVASLDRIEVVNGPLSGLYGSGALAGAVNLIVPAGTDTHQLRATAGVGTNDYQSTSALWQGPINAGMGGSLGFTFDDDGKQTPSSHFKARTLTGKLSRLGQDDAGRVILRLSETDARTFPDASGGPRLASRRTTDSRKGREQLFGVSLPAYRSDEARLDLSVAVLNRRDDTVSPGVAPSTIDPGGLPAGEDISRYTRASGQAVGRLNAGDWTLGGGVEVLNETGDSTGKLNFGFFSAPNSFALNRLTVSGFAEANRKTGALTINTGVRVDDVEGLTSRVTARAGMRYAFPDSNLALRASVGSGFKAPSFYALGNPFVGNRNLKPEQSLSAEAGLEWRGAAGDTASITAFRSTYKDLIDFIAGPPPRLENRDKVVSQGVSARARHAVSDTLAVTLQAQYASTEDDASGDQLLNRPRWRVNTALSWRPSQTVEITARHAYIGARRDYAIPVGEQRLNGYNTLGLEAAVKILPSATLRLVVDNALDDDHEDALGFTAAGASSRLYLSYQF